MRMFKTAFLSALIVTGSLMTAKADDAGRIALARDVVKNAQATENMRQLFPTMVGQLKPMLAQQGANPQAVEEITSRLSMKLSNELPKFTDLVAQVYAREFTEEDLNNLNAFYKSPTGQKMVTKQPLIAQFMATVGSQWGQNIAREVLQDYLKDKLNNSLPQKP